MLPTSYMSQCTNNAISQCWTSCPRIGICYLSHIANGDMLPSFGAWNKHFHNTSTTHAFTAGLSSSTDYESKQKNPWWQLQSTDREAKLSSGMSPDMLNALSHRPLLAFWMSCLHNSQVQSKCILFKNIMSKIFLKVWKTIWSISFRWIVQ